VNDGNAGAGTAAKMLGLPGFVVLGAAEYGGELELLIETTETQTGCPGCGWWPPRTAGAPISCAQS
jgi:hypothetical protein